MRPATLALLLLAACGARTELPLPTCDGGSRPCLSVCGSGTQQCVAGIWSRCEPDARERPCTSACGSGVERCGPGGWEGCALPPVRLPCTNICGEGTAACVDGVLGECEVSPRQVACENDCGTGTASCTDGVRGACLLPPTDRVCSDRCGEGVQFCVDGRWGPCEGTPVLPPLLEARIRDFRDAHPDFEGTIGDDRGMVDAFLDAEGKPVYRGPTPTTNGQERFDEWTRDVPGVNLGLTLPLELRPAGGGLFAFSDTAFFPIDDQLFGNEGREHNFHFTLEAETFFVYEGGEIFRFRGDDDVFVFINGRLAIDLGGVHAPQEATVELDALAESHGLVPGERYPLKLFFAERHTSGSSFTVETTLADPFRCGDDG
ncbi:MAG: fibro-slime domain-containing protein [Myxococcota bacterium]